jgi:hypothetical protein
MFAVLRRPPTRAERLRAQLYTAPHGPLPVLGKPFYTTNEWFYLNQIRLARTAFGASFYVFPPGT